MDIDAQAWSRLRDLSCRWPPFQDHAPGAEAHIIHDLRVAVHMRAIRDRVSGRSGLFEDEGDVVERRRANIRRLMGARAVLRDIRERRATRLAFPSGPGRADFVRAVILLRLRGGTQL